MNRASGATLQNRGSATAAGDRSQNAPAEPGQIPQQHEYLHQGGRQGNARRLDGVDTDEEYATELYLLGADFAVSCRCSCNHSPSSRIVFLFHWPSKGGYLHRLYIYFRIHYNRCQPKM